MPIRTVECDTWAEFKIEIFAQLYGTGPFRRGLFLFRGQRSYDWKLESSFDRWFNGQKKKESLRVETAKKLLDFFRREVEDFRRDIKVPIDEFGLLALGQHYGLPTRLLDWSESPYIAAFFAFLEAALEAPVEEISSDRVAIVALDTQNYLFGADRGIEVISIPRIDNPRLRNQVGRFTHARASFSSIEQYIDFEEGNGNEVTSDYPLVKFTIPDTEAEIALAELDGMGINPAFIYPDLSGCATAAKLMSRIVNLYAGTR